MKLLSSPVISTTRSGNYQYAVVENINLGLVTVRLGGDGTGQRLTNLNIVGTAAVGDLVVVDYSTNVPYVRTITHAVASEALLTAAAIPLELPIGRNQEPYICDPFALGDGECCGSLAYIYADIAFGTPLYYSWGFAAASATTIATAKVIGMGVGGDLMLLDGWANSSSWSFASGDYLFLAEGGGITQTKPTATDTCVTVLGIAISTSLIRFKPELVVVELL